LNYRQYKFAARFKIIEKSSFRDKFIQGCYLLLDTFAALNFGLKIFRFFLRVYLVISFFFLLLQPKIELRGNFAMLIGRISTKFIDRMAYGMIAEG
jgi:hypothetical protein